MIKSNEKDKVVIIYDKINVILKIINLRISEWLKGVKLTTEEEISWKPCDKKKTTKDIIKW